MGPDISKGINSQVSVQACHKDGGNQVRFIEAIFRLLIKSNRYFYIQQRIKFILMNYVWNQVKEK
jgi:hypothetical protein